MVIQMVQLIRSWINCQFSSLTPFLPFLNCIYSYVQTHKVNDAMRLCELGITYAEQQGVLELEEALKKAKIHLETQCIDQN
jgi:hypothetical protein